VVGPLYLIVEVERAIHLIRRDTSGSAEACEEGVVEAGWLGGVR
jgi:hypothetical protein